jgi:hypothetical protein
LGSNQPQFRLTAERTHPERYAPKIITPLLFRKTKTPTSYLSGVHVI